MEFEAVVLGEVYRFSFLNNNSVLVSGKDADYILYKNKVWKCADDISADMVEELGEVIDEQVRKSVCKDRNSVVEAVASRIENNHRLSS
jgi:hypothetical protein